MSGTRVESSVAGTTSDGQDVIISYKMTNGLLELEVLSLGGVVKSIRVPDRHGKVADVVLGLDAPADYEVNGPYLGCLVGRVGNRIANAKCEIDGKRHTFVANNGPHHLHGGTKGYNKMVWESSVKDGVLHLNYRSPDGEEGYPGTVDAHVTYTLGSDCSWTIDYTATADKLTPVNLTHHAYFNLAGHDSGLVDQHRVTIAADNYLPKDGDVPNGKVAPVEGTEFDLREGVVLADRLETVEGGGYDHNFCLTTSNTGDMKLAARVVEPSFGRTLECRTTAPGVQLYTGNFLNETGAKGGATYPKHSGLCLETQGWPDAVNQANFPSILVGPGQTYRHTTTYTFGVSK